MRTPEQALTNYAQAYAAVVSVQNLISVDREKCLNVAEEGEEPTYYDCIDRLFGAPRGPDGEFPRFGEFYDAMCERCKNRIALLDERKQLRGKLGAAKRTCLAVGRRLVKAGTK